MRFTPTIVFAANPKKDAELFWAFLNHAYFLDRRKRILNCFPALGSNPTKRFVTEYVLDFYQKHKREIQVIVDAERRVIRRDAAQSFRLLSDVMEYEWSRPLVYRAYTTLLPFSPFGKRCFYYSILRRLKHPTWKTASSVYIGAHEISHMIFFELLKQVEKKHRIQLHPDTRYFLQEALTTVLLNRQQSRQVLRKSKKEPGNMEIQSLRITYRRGPPQTILDFVGSRYTRSRRLRMSFFAFLESIVVLLHSVEKEFRGKRKLWNRFNGMAAPARLLTQYEKPIAISSKSA